MVDNNEFNSKTFHNCEFHNHDAHSLGGMRLMWVTILNVSITIVQIVGGICSNSLSLISDALHNLGDSSAIMIAFFAGRRASKQPDERKTFGYRRAEILAALFNSVVLISICVYLLFEAFGRFINPQSIDGGLMFGVALFGLFANLLSMLLLKKGRKESLNIKAAYFHLLGDTLSSVAVIFGGLAIMIWDVYWIDPLVCTFAGLYVMYHAWNIVRQTVSILMQAVPLEIDVVELKSMVEQIECVSNMHHLHLWQMDDKRIYLEAHINVERDISLSQARSIILAVETMLKDVYDVYHVTLQLEFGGSCGCDDLISKADY